MNKKYLSILFLFLSCSFTVHVSAITITTYTDKTEWENAVASYTIIEEGFNGSQNYWTGTDISAGIVNVNIIGTHTDDNTPIGVTGTGLFSAEVDSSNPIMDHSGSDDSSGIDGVNLKFNYSNFGFGLIGIDDGLSNSSDTIDMYDIAEIGVDVNGEKILFCEILALGNCGLDDHDRDEIVPFIGFTFDSEMINSFTFIHSDQVHGVDGDGGFEDFTLDGIVFATGSVPEPGSLAIFAIAFIGLVRRRDKS